MREEAGGTSVLGYIRVGKQKVEQSASGQANHEREAEPANGEERQSATAAGSPAKQNSEEKADEGEGGYGWTGQSEARSVAAVEGCRTERCTRTHITPDHAQRGQSVDACWLYDAA